MNPFRLRLACVIGASALASAATGDNGPVMPGILACSPPGGPPITHVCDDGHNCCIMPVYDIQGQLLYMAATCCIKGSECKTQRVGEMYIVFCAFQQDPDPQ